MKKLLILIIILSSTVYAKDWEVEAKRATAMVNLEFCYQHALERGETLGVCMGLYENCKNIGVPAKEINSSLRKTLANFQRQRYWQQVAAEAGRTTDAELSDRVKELTAADDLFEIIK